jgi:hypothetical protein
MKAAAASVKWGAASKQGWDGGTAVIEQVHGRTSLSLAKRCRAAVAGHALGSNLICCHRPTRCPLCALGTKLASCTYAPFRNFFFVSAWKTIGKRQLDTILGWNKQDLTVTSHLHLYWIVLHASRQENEKHKNPTSRRISHHSTFRVGALLTTSSELIGQCKAMP